MSDNHTKKGPGTGVRVLLRILSIPVCILLSASLLMTALLADIQLLTSKNGMNTIIDSMLSAPPAKTAPLTASVGVARAPTPDSNSILQDALTDWISQAFESATGEELPVTSEQIEQFLDQSTLKEYLSEKAASYMDDFLNGTANTTITATEIRQLLEDNRELIESTFGITITQEMQDQIAAFVEESEIDRVIREEVIRGIRDLTIPDFGGTTLPDSDGFMPDGGRTLGDLISGLQALTSMPVLIAWMIGDLVLIAALFFLNRMRAVSTLVCTGIPFTVTGSLLAIPLVVAQVGSGLLTGLTGSEMITGFLLAASGMLAPVHYGCLILGLLLIAIAILIGCIRKKKAA